MSNAIFNRYPEFVHGQARDEIDEFMLHTRFPRFLARVLVDDDFVSAAEISGSLQTDDKGKFFFICEQGATLQDFLFFDKGIDKESSEFHKQLTEACLNGIEDLMLLDSDLID